MIEQRTANLERMRHRHPVRLHQDIVGKPRLDIDVSRLVDGMAMSHRIEMLLEILRKYRLPVAISNLGAPARPHQGRKIFFAEDVLPRRVRKPRVERTCGGKTAQFLGPADLAMVHRQDAIEKPGETRTKRTRHYA